MVVLPDPITTQYERIQMATREPRVYRRTKRDRTLFRKLPFGASFWWATGLDVYQYQKCGRFSYLDSAGECLELADVSTAVIRVPKVWTSQIAPPESA